MEKLVPNSVIYEHYLLIEELSFDPATGQHVWSVQDQQTGQPFIVQFNSDGTDEWFNDNRPKPPKTIEKQQTEPPTDLPIEKNIAQPVAPVSGKKVVVFLALVTVLGASYLYYNAIVSIVKESISYFEKDSSSLSDVQDIPVVEKRKSPTAEVDKGTQSVNPISNTTQPELADSHFTVREAVNALNSINPSTTKYQRTFEEVRRAFVHLRNSESSHPLADSIYVLCAGKGAKAYFAFQQTKDQNLKRYSYEWYQTAYVLKPSPDLLDRLERLK